MSSILVRDLSPETVERLKARAKLRNRSLQAEVKAILDETVEGEARRECAMKAAAETKATAPSQTTDSTELIRADRER